MINKIVKKVITEVQKSKSNNIIKHNNKTSKKKDSNQIEKTPEKKSKRDKANQMLKSASSHFNHNSQLSKQQERQLKKISQLHRKQLTDRSQYKCKSFLTVTPTQRPKQSSHFLSHSKQKSRSKSRSASKSNPKRYVKTTKSGQKCKNLNKLQNLKWSQQHCLLSNQKQKQTNNNDNCKKEQYSQRKVKFKFDVTVREEKIYKSTNCNKKIPSIKVQKMSSQAQDQELFQIDKNYAPKIKLKKQIPCIRTQFSNRRTSYIDQTLLKKIQLSKISGKPFSQFIDKQSKIQSTLISSQLKQISKPDNNPIQIVLFKRQQQRKWQCMLNQLYKLKNGQNNMQNIDKLIQQLSRNYTSLDHQIGLKQNHFDNQHLTYSCNNVTGEVININDRELLEVDIQNEEDVDYLNAQNLVTFQINSQSFANLQQPQNTQQTEINKQYNTKVKEQYKSIDYQQQQVPVIATYIKNINSDAKQMDNTIFLHSLQAKDIKITNNMFDHTEKVQHCASVKDIQIEVQRIKSDCQSRKDIQIQFNKASKIKNITQKYVYNQPANNLKYQFQNKGKNTESSQNIEQSIVQQHKLQQNYQQIDQSSNKQQLDQNKIVIKTQSQQLISQNNEKQTTSLQTSAIKIEINDLDQLQIADSNTTALSTNTYNDIIESIIHHLLLQFASQILRYKTILNSFLLSYSDIINGQIFEEVNSPRVDFDCFVIDSSDSYVVQLIHKILQFIEKESLAYFMQQIKIPFYYRPADILRYMRNQDQIQLQNYQNSIQADQMPQTPFLSLDMIGKFQKNYQKNQLHVENYFSFNHCIYDLFNDIFDDIRPYGIHGKPSFTVKLGHQIKSLNQAKDEINLKVNESISQTYYQQFLNERWSNEQDNLQTTYYTSLQVIEDILNGETQIIYYLINRPYYLINRPLQ